MNLLVDATNKTTEATFLLIGSQNLWLGHTFRRDPVCLLPVASRSGPLKVLFSDGPAPTLPLATPFGSCVLRWSEIWFFES